MRIWRIGAGFLLILLGLIGLALPLMPGILFLMAGLAILATEFFWARALWKKLRSFLRKFFGVFIFLTLSTAIIEAGENLNNVPPELKGSPESLEKQNAVADSHGLERAKNNAVLRDLICRGRLVKVVLPQETPTFYFATEPRFRYARPWTSYFLHDLSQKFFAEFGKPLKITSIVRTEVYQNHLVRRRISDANGSSKERRSSHLTGAAFDISKRPLTRDEIQWLREELIYWEQEKMVEATEEIYNNAFHIMVFPEYTTEDKILRQRVESQQTNSYCPKSAKKPSSKKKKPRSRRG